MNMKHLLLLPLIIISSIKALFLGEALENSKNALRECQKSMRSGFIGCKQYEQEYKKLENQLAELIREEVGKKLQDGQPIKIFNFTLPHSYDKTAALTAHVIDGLGEPIRGYSDGVPKFENTDLSFEDYCEKIIKVYLHPGTPTTYVTDMKGPVINETTPQKDIVKAEQSARETFKKIAQQKIN